MKKIGSEYPISLQSQFPSSLNTIEKGKNRMAVDVIVVVRFYILSVVLSIPLHEKSTIPVRQKETVVYLCNIFSQFCSDYAFSSVLKKESKRKDKRKGRRIQQLHFVLVFTHSFLRLAKEKDKDKTLVGK